MAPNTSQTQVVKTVSLTHVNVATSMFSKVFPEHFKLIYLDFRKKIKTEKSLLFSFCSFSLFFLPPFLLLFFILFVLLF